MVAQLEHLGLEQRAPTQQPVLRRMAPIPGQKGRHTAPLDPQDHTGLVAGRQPPSRGRAQHTQAPAGVPGQLKSGNGPAGGQPQGVADPFQAVAQRIVVRLAVVQQVAHGQAPQHGEGSADVIRVRVGQHEPV